MQKNITFKKMCYSLLLCFMACCFNSCYRMPNDDDYSLVPSTNNPEYTRQRQEMPIPQGSY